MVFTESVDSESWRPSYQKGLSQWHVTKNRLNKYTSWRPSKHFRKGKSPIIPQSPVSIILDPKFGNDDCALADLRGAPGTHTPFSYSFQEKFGQVIGLCPTLEIGAPSLENPRSAATAEGARGLIIFLVSGYTNWTALSFYQRSFWHTNEHRNVKLENWLFLCVKRKLPKQETLLVARQRLLALNKSSKWEYPVYTTHLLDIWTQWHVVADPGFA